MQTNFGHLRGHDEQLWRLGLLAEKYFPEDPNTCLLKLRQLTELLAQLVASQTGVFLSSQESHYELLRRLQDEGLLPREVAQVFNEVRRLGNAANHALVGDHRTALSGLKLTWQLGLWFHRTFQDPRFKSGPFIPPQAPQDESEALRAELAQLRADLTTYQAAHQETLAALTTTAATLRDAQDEQRFWEQLALEVEQDRTRLAQQLADQQAAAAAQPRQTRVNYGKAAQRAAQGLQLDEASTRQLIDQQLRGAGWEADSKTLTYGQGTRPEPGKNRAIAEWPTAHGPADYVLFVGLRPIATVEAKRKNTDVSSALQQAKRYSRGFQLDPSHQRPGGPWGDYALPFTFSSNGRPYLRQLETLSGVWFCDVRRPDQLSRALEGWYTPEGLVALLKQDGEAAHQRLAAAPFNYDLQLRPYQQAAIRAVEAGIAANQRALLLAMATGTGKTKTCIALIYRLLKAQRFQRVLFLVDRAALGDQAANAFQDTRLENLQTFADIFGLKGLESPSPDQDTTVHIATVQGMVKRILYPTEATAPPPIDQYDCLVVDECHRGYLLDRELSEPELSFRSQEDYISKYRRVLDYFDAVKIGLTATPALHTSQIFGPPIFTYSYREAVIDGYLVDHEPPDQVITKLARQGIQWKAGDVIQTYNVRRQEIDLFTTPDEINLKVADFNRRVISQSFNRVVCEYLARELDPSSRQKTLVFCVNDNHADLVVTLLKQAFQAYYGSIEDDAVIKITGSADQPLQLIRRFKNERLPNVAVTVDLLTTGIDVPEICNLVFLRQVNSRILFDQMLGRATRPCDAIGKLCFRIFDAVQIYAALKEVTAMQPVVVNPQISFSQLVEELTTLAGEVEQALVRDQLVAKLQRKRHHLSETAQRDFETLTGHSPTAFIEELRQLPLAQATDWLRQLPALGDILDRRGDGPGPVIFISDHEDELHSVERGYGQAQQPEDFLQAFRDYIRSHSNTLPALVTVLTRPRDLTRQQLRQLALELDKQGFTEANLTTAWRAMTNQEMAARIIGYIRQAAIGDPLEPYEQRVDRALQRILASRPWSTPQRQWLQRIAAQTKANLVVDREALDDPDLIFRREGGGFTRLNRLFDGQLVEVLERFKEELWRSPAA